MILDYILQVILFQLVFLLVFEILLKKETFYNYNRFYLLITPVIALLLPLLKLEFLAEAVPQNVRIDLPGVITGNSVNSIQNLPEVTVTAEATNINWWTIGYFAGFSLSLILFIRKYITVNHLFRFRKVSEEKAFRIIEIPNSNMACTFFNTIFLGDQLSDNERNQILSHELVHVKQKHSFDLIFFEIMKIILWFNPLIYIYQSRIAGLHEFIADEEVVKTTGKKTYYEQLLNTAFNTQNISFTNQFFKNSLIKKRIIMLQKHKSSKLSKFKFLLIIPIMLSMLTYVACSEDPAKDLEMDETEVSVAEKIAELKTYLENKDSLTQEEKTQFLQLLRRREELLLKEKYSKNPEIIEVVETDNSKWDSSKKIPFAVIDKVPAFPNCEKLEGKERKSCTSREISLFVNKNFDTSLGKKLGLSGIHRVIVQFRIDETGNIQDIKARAAKPELEEEAKRVIASIPQMQPGEQNGQPVSVMYSLPIAFQVTE